jgi:hypothetical protein
MGGYGRLPSVCVDSRGRWWVVYIRWNGGGEQVEAQYKEPNGKWSHPIPVSDIRPLVTGVSMASWKDGVLVAWIDGNNPDNDGVKLRECTPSGGGEMGLVVPFGQIPAHVSLATHESVFTLAWTVRNKGDRILMASTAKTLSALSDPVPVSQSDGFHLRPVVVQFPEDAVIVWQGMSRGISRILACRFSRGDKVSKAVQISGDGQTIYASPTACRSKAGGCWIAWQSDSDPASSPGLVRWIEVAHLSKDDVIQRPKQPMSDVNRQGEGEDQGFESPSLACFPDGQLVVIGRGSQSVCRQDLGAAGWTGRSAGTRSYRGF